MTNFIMGIISLSVGVVVLSGVFIQTTKNAWSINGSGTTPCISGWNGSECAIAPSASETALFGLLTIVGIAGLVYGVLNVFGLA